ncbi:hypothetical protein [[Clostridium] scindens]|uniref:hypothetical protein n=1 Tax=Clostridium scindens (strain JCM 10418 / VPI 12708) TaxID=29347 RepID=UPI001C7071B7|nr:hypothetical protein [[Clostridium] scindens]QYX28394.1 hypothetical protein K0036_07310 [[Clostridium] scindens]
MQIITGIGESEHVTSMQHRAIFEMVIGDNSYILNKGELLEPELQSNNALKIRSGMLAHHGCICEVAPNTYDEVAIGNGSQSMKRIDLVVARYTQNAETKVERTEWTVIQGQPVESNPVAPDYIHGNMQDGDLTDDCPVFEVHLDGIQVVEIKKLLNVLGGSLAELNRKLTYVKTDISQNLKVYREGRRVTVQGLVLINGTSTTFELPYTATDVTRFSAVGLSNSLALAGYSFGTVKGAACEITFGNAITYAAVNFAYYTNL